MRWALIAVALAFPLLAEAQIIPPRRSPQPNFCHAAAISAVGFVPAVIHNRQHTQWHHFYLGMIVACIPQFPKPIKALGVWWAWDDAHQHVRQTFHPSYESAWHKLYVGMVLALPR